MTSRLVLVVEDERLIAWAERVNDFAAGGGINLVC
jgi:hypothetical protein